MKNLTVISLLLSFYIGNGQTLKKGCEYNSSTGICSPFKYSLSYSNSGNNFVTTYNIYEPTTGELAIIITATHFKDEKKVVVEVKWNGGGIFDQINKREVTYDTASLQPFGREGVEAALGDDKTPNEIEVKFVSNKYENIKVMEIMGEHKQTPYNTAYFILEK